MTIGISAIPALSRTMQGEEMLQLKRWQRCCGCMSLAGERSGWRRN